MNLDWLMENAAPIVRWRTANELRTDATGSERDSLARQLMAFPLVQEWLQRLTLGDFSTSLDSLETASGRLGGMVHGSKSICLENVLGKLCEFGLRAGMPELDERMLPFMRIFRWKPVFKNDATYQDAWEALVKSVFAWGLLRMGYPPDEAMKDFLLSHLRVCHKIARDKVYDIYATESELVGLPKAWKGKPIIKQEVMANYWLPYIHDEYVFAHLPAEMLDATTTGMIDELIAYILDPYFQALRDGYGYAWIKERRTCYGWGWSPHLKEDATRLLRLELMSHFPRARQSTWFQETLLSLETYRTPEGHYRLPGEYLHEGEGYYVTGSRMGLGENRRKPIGVEIESTFRLCLVKKEAKL